MTEAPLRLIWIEGDYAVCRLAPDAAIPPWATAAGGLCSITQTASELSIVVRATVVPDGVTAEAGWRAMAVEGTLDFGLVGVLARLSGTLAEAGVSIFVLSTYDTDVIMVKAEDVERAVDALAAVADVTRLRVND